MKTWYNHNKSQPKRELHIYFLRRIVRILTNIQMKYANLVGWNNLSIPKLQHLHRWSLGMDK